MSRFSARRHRHATVVNAVLVTPSAISGTRGGTLTATPAVWLGATSVSAQWYADGVATGISTVTYDDALTTDKTLEYRETALPGSVVASGWCGTLALGLLADDFNDNNMAPLWGTGGMYYRTADAPDPTGVSVAEAAQQGQVQPGANLGGLHENGFKTLAAYDLRVSTTTIDVPLDLLTINNSQQVYLAIGVDKDNSYACVYGGTSTALLKKVGGVYTFVGTGGNYSGQSRFRLRHKADNTLHFQLAPVSDPNNFTTVFSEVKDAGIDLSAARVGFGSNTFASVPTTLIPFDNLTVAHNLLSANLQDQPSGAPGKRQLAISLEVGISGATGAEYKVETEAGALVQGWTALTYAGGTGTGTYLIPDFGYEGQKLRVVARNVGGATVETVANLSASIPYALQQQMRVGLNDSIAPYYAGQMLGRDIFEFMRQLGDISIIANQGVGTVGGQNAILPTGLSRDNYHGWADAYSGTQSYPAIADSDDHNHTVNNGLQWMRINAHVPVTGVAPTTANATANGWMLDGLADASLIGLTADGRPTQLPADTNLTIAFNLPNQYPSARYPFTIHCKTQPGVKHYLRNAATTTMTNIDLVAGTFDLNVSADDGASIAIDRTGTAPNSTYFLSGVPSYETGAPANDIGGPYAGADKLIDVSPFFGTREMKTFGIEETAGGVTGTRTAANNTVGGTTRQWKYQTDTATRAGHGMVWANVPYGSDDTYIDAMATWFRDNFAGEVWVEYANELWNSGYASTQKNMAEATALGISNGQLVARKFRLMAQRFEAIFTGANAARLKPVLAWQIGTSTSEIQSMLDFENTYQHTKMFALGPYYGVGVGAGTMFLGPWSTTPADLKAAVAANDRTTFNSLLDGYLRAAINAVIDVTRVVYDFLPGYSVSKGLNKNTIGYATYEGSQHMMVTDPGSWDANLGAGMGNRAIDFFGSFKRTATFGAIEAYYIDQFALKAPHLMMIHDYVGVVSGYQGWGHMDRTGNRTDHSYSDVKAKALTYNA